MNLYLLLATVVMALAFFMHLIVGDREMRAMAADSGSRCDTWIQTRCGWHWVSLDLLLITIALAVLCFTDLIAERTGALLLIAMYLGACAVVWLATVAISARRAGQYLKLGQWILLLAVCGLVYCAAVT